LIDFFSKREHEKYDLSESLQMETIRQAVERAKAHSEQQNAGTSWQQARSYESRQPIERVDLDVAHLQSRRIVAYDGMDPRARPFDILRTEVLQSMELQGWNVLAVTSPTPSCGKTLVAVNLALSMGRQPGRQVLLADLDVRKPQVAASLGLKRKEGLIDLVGGRIELDRAIVPIRAGKSSLDVLATAPNPNAAEILDAAGFHNVLKDIADYARSRTIVLDMPPLLISDDVISVLPYVDCVLLVGAVGVSKVAEIEECEKHLQATNLVRFVLNKVPASNENYAYY
jgi:hypothetical protein